jgi:hypothetical protein
MYIFLFSSIRSYNSYGDIKGFSTLSSGSSTFPKKFCRHRWCENSGVVDRAIDLLPALRKYVETVKPKPTTASFQTICDCLKDKFLVIDDN